MNVLYNHRTQGKGVEGIHIRNVVQALRNLGHKVSIISPPGCDPFLDDLQTTNRSKKTLLGRFFSFVSQNMPEIAFEFLELAYNLSAYLKISRHIKKEKPDFIYERYYLFSIASMYLAKKQGIPIIYEVNDSSFVPRLRKLIMVKLANRLERYVFQEGRAIIVVTENFKNHLTNLGIAAETIHVCHNAIDPARFNPSKVQKATLPIPSDRTVLGFVGLFVSWVGLDSLIHAFSKIYTTYRYLHLLLVGGGPEEKNLFDLIKKLGLEGCVTITGRVSHEIIPSYIKCMDICLIPKHEKYTSPVKLFEYMAMGKAVLVPAYPSIKEIIRSGENGMLFEPDKEEQFLQKLGELLNSPDLLSRLGNKARKDVLEKYTWRQNAKRILQLAQ